MNAYLPECKTVNSFGHEWCKCLKIECNYLYKKDDFLECLVPNNLEFTASIAQAKKQDTRDQYLGWRIEVIRLAKTRRYRSRLDICRVIKERIYLDGGVSVTAEHICRAINISDAEFKKIIKKSSRKSLVLNK